jgi:hypothetical protein
MRRGGQSNNKEKEIYENFSQDNDEMNSIKQNNSETYSNDLDNESIEMENNL